MVRKLLAAIGVAVLLLVLYYDQLASFVGQYFKDSAAIAASE